MIKLPVRYNDELDEVTDNEGNFICDTFYDGINYQKAKAMGKLIADALNVYESNKANLQKLEELREQMDELNSRGIYYYDE